ARLPGLEARGEARSRGGRLGDDRGGEAIEAAGYLRDRARAAFLPEDQTEGLQLRAALRTWRVHHDLRRRGPTRAGPAEEGGDRLPPLGRQARHVRRAARNCRPSV